jgi:hypothetical protein
MNRGKLAIRYAIATVIWGLLLHMNYQTAQKSVLPIRESILLPSFVVPACLMLNALSFLVSALLARSRAAELLDPRASLSIETPLLVTMSRLLFGGALIVSGTVALVGRSRPDLLYSTAGWAWFWIVMGTWSLTNTSFRRLNVEISPNGIQHPQVRPSSIRWEDVADVRLKRWLFSSFVLVKFREHTDFRLNNLLWRWRKVKQLTVLPNFFGVDAETLANGLKLRRDLHVF